MLIYDILYTWIFEYILGSHSRPQPVGISEEGSLQVGFERPEQALDLVTEACTNLKLPLGSDLRLAINCAAHCLMDYVRTKQIIKLNLKAN